MSQRRVHPVNPALIAHSVPLAGCERIPFLFISGLCLIPIAATGVTHWQPDLFAVVVFFPLWALGRMLYLYDPRSAAKLAEHLSWVTERYSPRVPLGAKRAAGRQRGALRLVVSLLKQSIRS
jgi:hypothetical protein